MSHPEQHDADQAFARWWDARFIDGFPDAAADPEIDPDLAAFAQRVHALIEPAAAMEDARSRVWEEIMQANADILRPPAAPLGGFAPSPNGTHAPARVTGRATPSTEGARPAPTRRRAAWALNWAAGAALVAVVIALAFHLWQRGEQFAVQPAASPVADAGTPAGAWPMPRGNVQRTDATSDAGPTGAFQEFWSFSAAGELNEPLVSGDTVFIFGDGGVLFALDRAKGTKRWEFDTGGPFSGAYAKLPYPQVEGDTIYVGSAIGSVYALATTDGSVRWTADLGAQGASAMLVAGDMVYTSTMDGVFLALDPATGAERWRYQGQGFDNTFPAFWNGTVYVGGASGDVLALEAATGAPRWHVPMGGRVRTTPIENGVLFVSSDDGTVHALDAATGVERWSVATGGDGTVTSPAVGHGIVVVGVSGVGLLALDAVTGDRRWLVEAGTRPDGRVFPPMIAGNAVYAFWPDRDGIGGFDLATGAELGFAPTDFSGRPPAIADGTLYIGSERGTLRAFGSGPALAPATPGSGEATPSAETGGAPAAGVATPAATRGVNATHLWTVPVNGGMPIELGPDGNLWVADGVAGGMLVLDRDGNVRAKWSAGTGPALGQLDFKSREEESWWGGLAFAADGGPLVAECGNARVQHLSPAGEPIAAWGSAGRGDGQFVCPAGIAVAPNGEILVADLKRGDIQRFSADGGFLGLLGGPDGAPLRFAGPLALSFDQAGNLVLVEIDLRQIRVIAPDGSTLLAFGGTGSGDAALVNPMDVTVDEAGNFYVADQQSGRVAVFDQTGAYVGNVTVTTPTGADAIVVEVAYGGNGSLYVEEVSNEGAHVQKFSVLVTAGS